MKHLMIDIETLGRRHDCIITQIGACFFNPTGIPGETGPSFKTNVDIHSQKGRTITTDTIQFWLSQPHEASEHIRRDDNPSLREALIDFLSFYRIHQENGEKIFMWANGAAFDFPKLEDAFASAELGAEPWVYHEICDLRTIRNLVFPRRNEEEYQSDAAKGEGYLSHDALADCYIQAAMLQELMSMVKGGCSFCTG
jgi:exodeoxyribonuclease VIII